MDTAPSESFSIVALDKFIQATRDSGYKGTPSAVAELVDNSLQAGARNVDISIALAVDPEFPIEVIIADDGSGMDPFTLRQALRFGGSSRFDDRNGMGRYGMGLPSERDLRHRGRVHRRRSRRDLPGGCPTPPSQPRDLAAAAVTADYEREPGRLNELL
jgi:hypothetical protein